VPPGFNVSGGVMRILLAAAALAFVGVLPAGAETRIFIIENHSDYGVDQCLMSGGRCGKVVASAYCQSRDYTEAVSFRKVEPDEITGGNSLANCHSAICAAWVAIECTR
jgi:hypothetical protein